MSFMNLKQSPSKDLIRGVAIKLLFGLPVAGFIWTIIFLGLAFNHFIKKDITD